MYVSDRRTDNNLVCGSSMWHMQCLLSEPLFCMCWDIHDGGYWGSVGVGCSSEQVQYGGVAVVNVGCGVST